MYSDQDFEELGRRAERKITKRKTKALGKKTVTKSMTDLCAKCGKRIKLKKQKLLPRNEAPVTLTVTATVITFLTVLKNTAR